MTVLYIFCFFPIDSTFQIDCPYGIWINVSDNGSQLCIQKFLCQAGKRTQGFAVGVQMLNLYAMVTNYATVHC